MVHGKVVERSKPVIVRTFPSYSSNPQGEKYGQYCRYQLIKYMYHPWSNNTAHSWQSDTATQDDYITAYTNFTNYAKVCVPSFAAELYRVQQYYSQDNEDETQDTHQNQDDWIHLCQLNHHFTA